MEFIQEPTLTAFIALVLSFVVVKIVSFAVSVTAITDGDGGSGITKEVKLGRKRVRFVDDDSGDGLGRLIGEVEAAVVGENLGERVVDQLGFQELVGDSGAESGQEDLEEIGDSCALDEGCGETRMVVGEVMWGDDAEDEVLGVGKVKNQELDDGGDERGDGIVDYGRNEAGEVEGIGRDHESDGDDDWEGIERSELDKAFAEAVNFVECGGKKGREERDSHPLVNLGSDVQVELYGLHKAAVEGPCHEPQPMALKMSARAKWNAWQRLGSMSPEAAMEEYIRILSDTVPGWTPNTSVGSPNLEFADDISAAECTRELPSTSTPFVDSSAARNSVDSVQKLPCSTEG